MNRKRSRAVQVEPEEAVSHETFRAILTARLTTPVCPGETMREHSAHLAAEVIAARRPTAQPRRRRRAV